MEIIQKNKDYGRSTFRNNTAINPLEWPLFNNLHTAIPFRSQNNKKNARIPYSEMHSLTNRQRINFVCRRRTRLVQYL